MKLNKHNLIVRIDCIKEYNEQEYFEHGDVRVVDTQIGRYREAEAKPLSRFGYRFAIRNIGKPHVAIIRYPDDKRRYMCIMDGTCYDLTTGIFTDFAQPISGQMLEIHQIFWPRWNDCSIVFMTWSYGEPAAVASIEIYELDELPALDSTKIHNDSSRREFGVQYEDPCGTGASEGAMSKDEWIDRVISYMHYTGQKLLVYPIAWYHGPQFPSNREPSDAFDVVVASDRKQYSRWTTQPPDWYSDLLNRFEEEGLEYKASLTLLRLGSLMQKMNIDLDSIKAGADTINNILWCDQVQAGTQDWTPTYNARNYNGLLESHDHSTFNWAYGEESGQHYHPGPIFNPLHPVVQEAIIGLVKEIVKRYGQFQSFKGISFNMWHATFLWFGSLHAGYDDYTINLFQQETGIRIPIDTKASDRFSKRYLFLMHTCRQAWVNWRCHKIHQLLCKIRDVITQKRSDMLLTITVWNEMTIPALLGSIGASHQLYARLSNVELYKEAGLDINLIKDEHGIEVDLQFEPQRDRSGWGAEGLGTPIEQATMFRDHDFLDRKTLGILHDIPQSGVFIFNSWVEAWGQHKWFPCEPDDTQADELAVMSGKPAEGIFRMNSEYPKDGFWWDSQLRITPAHPVGVHFMEHYAHAVAELDACRITRGGLFLDKSHSEEIARFALAYRALPKEKFETIGDKTDPVAVRTLVYNNKRYIYIINRDYYTIQVEIAFDRIPEDLTDLSTGIAIQGKNLFHLSLGSYELRSFCMNPEAKIISFTANSPSEITSALVYDANKALEQLIKLREYGYFIPGVEQMEEDIKSAIDKGCFAWLRRALSSYIVRKCNDLLEMRENND